MGLFKRAASKAVGAGFRAAAGNLSLENKALAEQIAKHVIKDYKIIAEDFLEMFDAKDVDRISVYFISAAYLLRLIVKDLHASYDYSPMKSGLIGALVREKVAIDMLQFTDDSTPAMEAALGMPIAEQYSSYIHAHLSKYIPIPASVFEITEPTTLSINEHELLSDIVAQDIIDILNVLQDQEFPAWTELSGSSKYAVSWYITQMNTYPKDVIYGGKSISGLRESGLNLYRESQELH